MVTQQSPVNMPQTNADAIQATQHVIAKLTAHRSDMVHNFQLYQQKAIEAIELLDRVLAAEGEKLQHLFNLQNNRPPPQQQQVAPQGQPQQAPVPNTVETSVPPQVQAQVSEVIEQNGQRTIFEGGQPVIVVPPPGPGAVPNGGIVQ